MEQRGHTLALSVPSSSGNKLQLTRWARKAKVLFPFSPLLIGEQTATAPRADSPWHPLSLSVPSSSGNKLQLSHPRVQWSQHSCLSVPSSSGNKLQLSKTVERGATPEEAFSPLLIGEQTATRTKASYVWPASGFQSPPHRGTNCNSSARARPAAAGLISFSPLLIGEQTATAPGAA